MQASFICEKTISQSIFGWNRPISCCCLSSGWLLARCIHGRIAVDLVAEVEGISVVSNPLLVDLTLREVGCRAEVKLSYVVTISYV